MLPLIQLRLYSYIAYASTYSPNYHSYYPMVRNVFSLLQNENSTEHIFKNKSLLQPKRQPPNLKNFLIRAKFSMTDDSARYINETANVVNSAKL